MSICIEYKRISEYNKQWLHDCGATWSMGQKFLDYEPHDEYLVFNGACQLKFTQNYSCIPEYTYCNTGDEFCSKVAELLGKEYKPMENDKKELTNEELKQLSKDDADILKKMLLEIPIFPHKTYRILESLEGIPLDTRIPLSEWIPPFRERLVFINSSDMVFSCSWVKGALVSIGLSTINVQEPDKKELTMIDLDGHWMRIV